MADLPIIGTLDKDKLMKWLKKPRTLQGLAAIVAVVLLLYLDFWFWDTRNLGGSAAAVDTADVEQSNDTFQWQETETRTGTIAGGGPGTVVPNTEEPFDVNETVVEITVDLSWTPQITDLDLAVEDPSGGEKCSSGNPPGESEHCTVKQRSVENGGPGTWVAVIDPFFAVSTTYTLDITLTYQVGGNATAGNSTDDGGP